MTPRIVTVANDATVNNESRMVTDLCTEEATGPRREKDRILHEILKV